MSQSTDSTRREQILASWQVPEYRSAFAERHVDTSVAFQIRANRDSRGWLQEDLGERLGKRQSWVSVLENPNYGRYSFETLKQLARVFDCALEVRFRPFSYLLDHVTSRSTGDLLADQFDRDDFAEAQVSGSAYVEAGEVGGGWKNTSVQLVPIKMAKASLTPKVAYVGGASEMKFEPEAV